MSEKRQGTTKLRDIAREAMAEVPSRERIDALPPLGDRSFAVDFSGIALAFHGLDEALDTAARKRFDGYLSADEPASPLRAAIHADTVEHYVEPERGKPEGYYRLRIVHDPDRIRLVTYSMAAWIDVARGSAGISFGTGSFDPRERALENFCRVAIAWMALARGGFFIHGASIVRDGKAYIFFGKSAAGKSTLAAMNTQGTVISDDLTLVLPGPAGLMVAGTPFRGTYTGGGRVVGTYPLAGLFRLVQDESTWTERPKQVQAIAEVVANLPFANDAFHVRPDALVAIEKAVSRVPIHFLHFTRDPGFWGAVDAALDAATGPGGS